MLGQTKLLHLMWFNAFKLTRKFRISVRYHALYAPAKGTEPLAGRCTLDSWH